MRKTYFTKAFLAFFLLMTISLMGFTQKLDLKTSLPLDSNLTKGKLNNGLTYYIRPNAKPEDKIELRLVINAGSILEEDNQQGLAHFMEHMNFNGLKHFPKNELIHYLQDIGVRFGADLNANTGFDRTYFILPIPTDNPENITNGFQILADWADGALISDEEVNDERKVISEELRMRNKNAGTRMLMKYLPDLVNGSRYGKRLPSGKDSIVMHADPDLIRQFYHDWYRPNLMAVIVVGDITTQKAESLIKKYFGTLKNPKNEKERVVYQVKPYSKPDAMIVTDPEATNYNLQILFPAREREIDQTLGDYKTSLIKNIFSQIINRKLTKLAQTANPPFVGAGVSLSGTFGSLTLKNTGFSIGISPLDNFQTAVDSVVAVLLRVQNFGFSQKDVGNAKKRILNSYERAYNERNKTTSNAYVGEYTRNFMKGEAIPGIENEYKYVRELLPTIKAKDVTKKAKEILARYPHFFALINGPEKGDIDLPNKEGLIKMVSQAFQQQVSQKEEEESATSLLTSEPIAGEITAQTQDKDLGTKTYTLSNGVKVTVKPTDFKNDQIIFKGVKFGGSNLYGVADKANKTFLSSVINTMGYGQFTPTALSDFLSGKTVSLGVGLGSISDNVNGSSSVKDFETLLQLNYLKLTHPRKDTNLYNGFITKMKSRLKYLKANPQMAFSDSLSKVLYGNSPLTPIRIPTQEDLEKINLDRVLGIYKNEFGNADGFHFFIVGNIDTATLKPLMEKYLASLPVKGWETAYVDNGLRRVKGDHTFKFYKGEDEKSMIFYLMYGEDVPYSEDLALKANFLGQIMTMQVNDTIREKMQVIYSGGASAGLSEKPYVNYTVSMQLPCGPENVDVILAEIAKEIKEYKTTGGPAGSLQKVKKAALEGHKENLKKNGYWAGKLENLMVWGKSKDFFLNYDKEVKEMTEQDIINTANILLEGNRFIGISYPEQAKAER